MPTTKDKCPVCGMFVAKYPDWIAQAIFSDGSYAVFDGPKDLFKYLFAVKRYTPSKEQNAIASLFVTDYYTLKPIDGTKAFYVMGSDMYGPMGKELVPFQNMKDAKEFLRDHKGKKILTFKDITPEVMKDLE
ncbi:MAG: nitrous oxide reductase accessory protein NosL [Nitrospirota bacterium]